LFGIGREKPRLSAPGADLLQRRRRFLLQKLDKDAIGDGSIERRRGQGNLKLLGEGQAGLECE
jgi:hypothetical protein